MTLLLLAMTSSRCEDLDDLCPVICEDPFYTNIVPSTYRHCHCAQQRKHTTATPAPSTTDVCGYLCAIQLGGSACECSRPSLPGRK
ncbi:hypothetical protein V1264_008093 [Littorina saxatilis]